MKRKQTKLLTVVGMILVLAMFIFTSCSQGVSVEDAQQMQEEIKTIATRLSEIETGIVELSQEETLSPLPSEVGTSLDNLIQELRDISVRLAEIEAKLDFPDPEAIDQQMATDPLTAQPAPTF